MFPGMNLDPRKMQSMLKQIGMKQEEIDASRVIIETSNKKIIINNPSVQKIVFQGQESFQVSGEISESGFSEEDINLIVEKTGKTPEEAKNALEKTGDIAEAIMSLSE